MEAGTDTGSVLIAGGVNAPARARDLVRSWLSAFLTAEELRDATLMASEVVTNAFLHGGASPSAPLRIDVSIRPGVVRVSVVDPGAGDAPKVHQPDPNRIGGLGLFIVDRLSRDWGYSTQGGTQVWFEVTASGV